MCLGIIYLCFPTITKYIFFFLVKKILKQHAHAKREETRAEKRPKCITNPECLLIICLCPPKPKRFFTHVRNSPSIMFKPILYHTFPQAVTRGGIRLSDRR